METRQPNITQSPGLLRSNDDILITTVGVSDVGSMLRDAIVTMFTIVAVLTVFWLYKIRLYKGAN